MGLSSLEAPNIKVRSLLFLLHQLSIDPTGSWVLDTSWAKNWSAKMLKPKLLVLLCLLWYTQVITHHFSDMDFKECDKLPSFGNLFLSGPYMFQFPHNTYSHEFWRGLWNLPYYCHCPRSLAHTSPPSPIITTFGVQSLAPQNILHRSDSDIICNDSTTNPPV